MIELKTLNFKKIAAQFCLMLLVACAGPVEKKPEISSEKQHDSTTKELNDAEVKSLSNDFLNALQNHEFTISSQEEPDRWRVFQDVNLSGSAQPSTQALKKILEKIKTHQKGKTVALVDARQEMHLMGDDDLQKYIAEKDWSEQHYKLEAIINDESAFVHTGKIEREEIIAKNLNLKYLRLNITDDAIPSAKEVERFLKFYSNQIKNDPKTWFHCHCEHGHGRTTTVMALVHILNTKAEPELGTILEAQHNAGGARLAFSSKIREDKDLELKRARFGFLQEFHQYVRDKKHGYFAHKSWSQWKKTIEE